MQLTNRFISTVGFLNHQKIPPMTSMAFHPHHMVLGCSTGDNHINLFEMGEHPEGRNTSGSIFAHTWIIRCAEDYKNALRKVSESLSPLGMVNW